MAPQNSACVVTVVARGNRAVWVRLIGALDIDARPALAATTTQLSRLAPGAVILDFAGVTFAGAALCHFLEQIHRNLPGAPILMQHASPQTRLVMIATGTDSLVVHDEEQLPWSAT
ncbi:STAS domain-containing protein [Paractinoplanes hotanensis]|uniref:STAS domain-containing protein n=1 Tax=Paractinoplanes hotanensis TaxID=2906497 RepID=A0ABT0Y4R4_9ACTN|nr:hypothetical protein [Actinoplanes hotanensis]MCM4081011.1 hypothetical protein [Actinoplanes hotanensis]